jgi:hypothetical protein
MLTPEEARELASKVKNLCQHPNEPDHIHVNDIDFTKEITVAIYTPENIKHFNKDIQRILASDD